MTPADDVASVGEAQAGDHETDAEHVPFMTDVDGRDEADEPSTGEPGGDVPSVDDGEAVEDGEKSKSGAGWASVVAFGLLPALALILAIASGYLKYVGDSQRDGDAARVEAVQTASASTVAILSYSPDKVEQELDDARNLLTGQFRDSYTSLINDVVIPGSKTRQISAVATVSRTGTVSANARRAVVLVFVDQTTVVGAGAPNNTASSVQVTLDKVGDKWLISEFTPV